MPNIKIISMPAGQAPEWVRQEWVGLELPIMEATAPPGEQIGALGGTPSSQNLNGYSVDTERAMAILSDKSPDAAQWWRDNVPLRMMTALVFGKQFCEPVI
ncbi:hypothetical protein HOB10_00015 [Candidatus Parcubacteria bacterium]|nr:hypothetical protein [Candidatus Parcubacteria bacterium]